MLERIKLARFQGDRRRKRLTYFRRALRAEMKCINQSSRISRLEKTLQAYAKYATKEAMERDIRLINE